MPTFEVAIPDGKNYQIEAPDFETAVRALVGSKQQAAAAPASPISAGDLVSSALDVPVLGPLARKADAAIRAAAAPLTNATGLIEKRPESTFGERYRNALASLDAPLEKFQSEHPIAAALSNIAGTAATAVPLGSTALGARALGMGATTLPAQMAAGAASGIGINAADAALRGNDIFAPAALGGALGAAIPPAARLAGGAAQAAISSIHARVNPESYAQAQVVRALMESGQTPAEIDAALARAASEGQGMFTAADAMGNPGQRMLSTVARAPGEGRTAVVDFLQQRQAGQGERLASTLAEGFGAPQTAERAQQAAEAARERAANIGYGAARADAGPVDLTAAIRNIDQTLAPGATQVARPQAGLARDSIESVLGRFRSLMTDNRSQLTNFEAVQRLRGDLQDETQRALNQGAGNRYRLLNGLLDQVDHAMEQASPSYRTARQDYATRSADIRQFSEGAAASWARPEDTARAFSAAEPQGQANFRVGYIDPKIAQIQNADFGVNKARPLTSDAFTANARTMSPQADLMARRIGRENTMFETRNAALGGSKTADNLADQAAMAVDPSLLGHLIQGNMMGALRGAMGSISALGGNTAAVRQQVAQLLLARGGTMPPGTFQRILDQTMRRYQTIQRTVQTLQRAGTIAVGAQANQ